MVEHTKNPKRDAFMLRLPDGMRDQLKTDAKHAGRSMNLEILARLENSLLPELPATTLRFRALLADMNHANVTPPLTTALIAKQIEGEDPQSLEDLFEGTDGGTFKLLDQIATITGVNPDWLKHGQSLQYPVTHNTECEGLLELLFAKWPQQVICICSEPSFRIAILIQYDNRRCAILSSNIRFIEHTYRLPRLALATFSNICCQLDWLDEPPVSSMVVTDYCLDDLIRGQLYGNTALLRGYKSDWVKDFWNPSQFRNPDTIAKYPKQWRPWFRGLCETIYGIVLDDELLRKERDAFLQGHFSLMPPLPGLS